MLETFLISFNVLRIDFVPLRILVVAIATALVMTPPVWDRKGGFRFIGQVTGLILAFILMTVLNTYLIDIFQLPGYIHYLSDVFRDGFVISLYSIFCCRAPRAIKCAVSGSLLAVLTICGYMRFSVGRMISDSGFSFLFLLFMQAVILSFAVFEYRFSLLKLEKYPVFGAVLIITTNTLAITGATAAQVLDTAGMLLGAYSILVYIILLILTAVGYLSIYFICKEHGESEKYKLENQMLRAGADQIALSRANLEDLRHIRHDLKNAHAYMSALLKEGRYEDLARVLEANSPVKITPEFYVDCGNSDISAILTAESSKAHSKGFRLQHTLMVPPVLPFESGELFSLLSNLIDNAIDSNERYGLTDDITVQINLREEYLYICVTNQLPPDVDTENLLKLKTGKDNPEEHGLGLQIVQRLAKKYNGYFLADVANQRFIAEVLMDMMYNKGGNAK